MNDRLTSRWLYHRHIYSLYVFELLSCSVWPLKIAYLLTCISQLQLRWWERTFSSAMVGWTVVGDQRSVLQVSPSGPPRPSAWSYAAKWIIFLFGWTISWPENFNLGAGWTKSTTFTFRAMWLSRNYSWTTRKRNPRWITQNLQFKARDTICWFVLTNGSFYLLLISRKYSILQCV